MWNQVTAYLTVEKTVSLLRALLLAALGLVLARVAASAVRRVTATRLDPSQVVLLRRIVRYTVLALFTVAALHELGFDLGVLLGAAGIVSVAIGFASQTSASNFISGLFLIAERPFAAGDVISVGGTTGEVLSIDLLSVKLRTFDNLFVRIPNETVIKSEVRTLTRFPLRRLDVTVGVAYGSDLALVRKVLLEVADRNPLSLEEPKPQIFFNGFGDSSINYQYSVWCKRENFVELKNAIQEELKQAFDEAGIEIPFPQRTLTVVADGLPVRLLHDGPDDAGG
ncbi:MAG: mechanosensitive ion channel family protein [Thermoanaerobaculia bacterium]|nr:mechanosensitive ion channel family protein [Thermoanaerobaculia bacterium]